MLKDKQYDKANNLRKHAIKKSENSLKKVENAIKELVRNNEPINFNSVANTANVSKPYLYKNQELRKKIESLRLNSNVQNKTIKKNMTDDNKDALITILRNKIKELEFENKELKEELKKHYGNIYDNI